MTLKVVILFFYLFAIYLERFPIECRKNKTKVITLANRNRCKQHNEPIRIRSKYQVSTGAKRGKTSAAKTRLVLVWIPIGLKSGASFVNQSQSVVLQNQSKREITFDTQSKTALFIYLCLFL